MLKRLEALRQPIPSSNQNEMTRQRLETVENTRDMVPKAVVAAPSTVRSVTFPSALPTLREVANNGENHTRQLEPTGIASGGGGFPDGDPDDDPPDDGPFNGGNPFGGPFSDDWRRSPSGGGGSGGGRGRIVEASLAPLIAIVIRFPGSFTSII